ncbi:MAG: DUF1684 domain-containing protein [Saprospiraceae bacterium]
MRILICLLPLLALAKLSHAQSFAEQIEQYRITFKEDMISDERAPLQDEDLQHLRWYKPDSTYAVHALFLPVENSPPIDVPTSSGRVKSFQDVGVLLFNIQGTVCTLHVYQNMGLMQNPVYQDHLFLPFTDITNGEDTYGGGRYIDLLRSELSDGSMLLDFNKAYNPWCAYSDGYNCPVPPAENRLPVAIPVGEMMYAGPHKHRSN